ncbi:MAG: phosphoribosylanthranilate isomerase [Anaerolineae bacterium]|nr:phosphoribosylanthranilate isomerase [Anaerolineae bacterium]MCI0706476.1 phosphoribosylanthranilate isomerase [Ignavibacteriota bacterium]
MQELFIKICGITNLEDAKFAVKCGAHALGFNFYEKSPRFIKPEEAADIIQRLPEHVSKIGVFVKADQRYIHDVISAAKLSAVQLHGTEGPDDLIDYEVSAIKVFRVMNDFDVEVMRNYVVDAFLLDTHHDTLYGGTGQTFNWNIAVKAKDYGRIILSGGLTPDNVEAAVRFVHPYGVDVCSGTEKHPGKKDHTKIVDFIARAKSVQLSYNEDAQEDNE